MVFFLLKLIYKNDNKHDYKHDCHYKKLLFKRARIQIKQKANHAHTKRTVCFPVHGVPYRVSTYFKNNMHGLADYRPDEM